MNQRDPKVLQDAAAADGDGTEELLDSRGPSIAVCTYEPDVSFDGHVYYEGSLDGSTYFAVAGARLDDHTLSTSDNGVVAIARQFDLTGLLRFRARVGSRTAGIVSSKFWGSRP